MFSMLKSARVVVDSDDYKQRKREEKNVRSNSLYAQNIFQSGSDLFDGRDDGDTLAERLERFRSKVRKFMSHSWIGYLYHAVLLTLSIFSMFEFIWGTYINPSNLNLLSKLNNFEFALASMFGFDWLLSFYLADHRLVFCRSFYSMVDLFTVIPVFATYGRRLPSAYDVRTFEDVFFYAMFLMSTTRILRVLRIRRYIKFIEDNVERYLSEMCINVTVMVLFFAAVMQFLEFDYQYYDYHTWMYYVWITITTVGYGDISPSGEQGRVAAMFFIGFSIIAVPSMTNQLIEKMALQSVYARTVYMPKSSNSKHVVVCGDISSVSLEEFFGELFHDDHETVGLVAVLLLPTPPSSELVILMEHSPYFSSVLYLEGSALNDKDLKRAKAELALAVFIMSNKFSRKADEEDAKSILLKLSIKRYVKTFKAPRQLFCLQLIRPQNKKHLGQDEHELGIGADQRDLNICLSEIKMGILAKAVMYPGVNTLLMNLISTFSKDRLGAEMGDTLEDFNTVSGRHAPKKWINEYTAGVGWEIYTTPLSPRFERRKFTELSYRIYKELGVLLFAVEVVEISTGKSRLLLNPGDYRIPSQNEFGLLAFVIAENQANADLTMASDAEAFRFTPTRAQSFHGSEKGSQGHGHGLGGGLGQGLEAVGQGLMGLVGGRKESIPSPTKKTGDSKGDNKGKLYHKPHSHQELVIHLKEEHFQSSYYLTASPLNLADVTVRNSITDVLPHINNHIIIIGRGLRNLFDLVRPLRAKYTGELCPIVILSPDDVPRDVWARICTFDAVYFVRGSPLEERNLRRAGIFHASRVVILADAAADTSASGMDALVDSDAIFSYQRIRMMNPNAQVVTEIVNSSSISYMHRAVHLDASVLGNYKFSTHFAAGELFSTSLLDCIVCQGFYNPHIISILNKLICGVDMMERQEKVTACHEQHRAQQRGDDFNGDSAKRREEGWAQVHGSFLCSMGVPSQFRGDCYGALFEHLSERHIIPLGLMRDGAAVESNRMPYVFTNPPYEAKLSEMDRVFVLSQRAPDDDMDVFSAEMSTPTPHEPTRFSLHPTASELMHMQSFGEHTIDKNLGASTDLDSLDQALGQLRREVRDLSGDMTAKLDALMAHVGLTPVYGSQKSQKSQQSQKSQKSPTSSYPYQPQPRISSSSPSPSSTWQEGAEGKSEPPSQAQIELMGDGLGDDRGSELSELAGVVGVRRGGWEEESGKSLAFTELG